MMTGFRTDSLRPVQAPLLLLVDLSLGHTVPERREVSHAHKRCDPCIAYISSETRSRCDSYRVCPYEHAEQDVVHDEVDD